MATSVHVSCSHTYPIPREFAYGRTLAWPLDELFDRRFGPIPPVTGTDQDGEWGTVGQERTIHTADGGSMRERLVLIDPPHEWRYEITDVTGPMKPVVGRVEASWAWSAVGTGCRLTWSWNIHSRSAAAGVALPVFGRLWKEYARRALDHLEELLLRVA